MTSDEMREHFANEWRKLEFRNDPAARVAYGSARWFYPLITIPKGRCRSFVLWVTDAEYVAVGPAPWTWIACGIGVAIAGGIATALV